MAVSTNPDLPSSWEVPGVYFSINFSGSGSGAPRKRLLLMGYKLASGSAALNSPVRVNGQSEADAYFGRGSDLARQYAAAVSQVGAGVIDVWCCPLAEPSSGTQSTRLIKVGGPATSSGSVDVYVCGWRASAAIASGDSATTIATNLQAELDKLLDVPCTVGRVGADLTLTYRHKGYVGVDLPLRVDQTGASGVTFSPGTITYANAAVGAGSATVKVSSTTVTAALAGGESAAAVATAVKNAINADGHSVTATDDGAGVVTLYFARERVVNGVSAAIVTTTGTTATVAAGVVVANSGTERPTLTTALTNISALPAFQQWSCPFVESTSMGTISSHIESQADGRNQKGQRVHVGAVDSLAVSGALADATTPKLTASPRYAVIWSPESPQQAYELAARTSARVCVEDYAPRNYDGAKLKTDTRTPLLAPHRAVRPSTSDQNAAIHTYYMTPLAVDDVSGEVVVVSGKTTSASANLTLHDWGVIAHIDYLRDAFSTRLSDTFKGVNLRRNGVPRTVNTVTVSDIRDACVGLAAELDAVDLYDGVDAFKAAFKAEPDAVVPGRVNCFVPLAVIRGLHQLGVVGAPV